MVGSSFRAGDVSVKYFLVKLSRNSFRGSVCEVFFSDVRMLRMRGAHSIRSRCVFMRIVGGGIK